MIAIDSTQFFGGLGRRAFGGLGRAAFGGLGRCAFGGLGRAALTLALVGSASACSVSYHARNAEDYKQATRALLESKQSDFTACYDGVLKATPDAKGTVAVSFVVEEDSGKITTPKSLPESTAPETLQACVVNGLNGLALDPPDARKGMATMTFDFTRG